MIKGGLLILVIGMLSGCSGVTENTGSINTQMKEADTTAEALDDESTKEWVLPEDYRSTFRRSSSKYTTFSMENPRSYLRARQNVVANA
jgi:uncharacterized protein YceK